MLETADKREDPLHEDTHELFSDDEEDYRGYPSTSDMEYSGEDEDSHQVKTRSDGMQYAPAEGEISAASNLDGRLPRDRERKTAFFDPAAEKQMTQAEGKLLYQRHQLENMSSSWSQEGTSPIIRARTFPSNFGTDGSPTNLLATGRPGSSLVGQNGSSQYRSALPVELAKQEQHAAHKKHDASTYDAFVQADEASKRVTTHTDLNLEPKGSLIDMAGIHGAGAGVGVGGGLGGFASGDAHITSELGAIYANSKFIAFCSIY